jgi:hypothetical protein
MVLIALALWLVRKTWHLEPTGASATSVIATRITFVLMWLAVWLGTLVTGSGPHPGGENVPRNALDGMLVTRLHTSVVYATVAASVICFALLRSRAVLLLVLVEILQAGIGIAQYQLGLPIELVALHSPRRFDRHCHGHQSDALGAAFRLGASGHVSHHAVRRLPSQRRHRWILASTSPWDPSTLTALLTSSLRTRRAKVTWGLQRPAPNWPFGSALHTSATRC